MSFIFNTGFFSSVKLKLDTFIALKKGKNKNIKNLLWGSLFFGRQLSSGQLWAYRILRKKKQQHRRFWNYRIFFSKKNKFYSNFNFFLGFSKLKEWQFRERRQRFFYFFLRVVYGLKRFFFFKKLIFMGLRKRVIKTKLDLYFNLLERQIVVVLVRLGFSVNGAWSKYIINRSLVFLNGFICKFMRFTVLDSDGIFVQLLEYINPIKLRLRSRSLNYSSNFFIYIMWLFSHIQNINNVQKIKKWPFKKDVFLFTVGWSKKLKFLILQMYFLTHGVKNIMLKETLLKKKKFYKFRRWFKLKGLGRKKKKNRILI